MYSVLLSTLGRSHYVIAAEYLIAKGVHLTLLQGWVPRNLDSFWVKLAAKVVGRKSFVAGLRKRMVPQLEGHVISSVWGELFQTALFMTIGRLGSPFYHLSAVVGFYIHGFCTKFKFRDEQIFHVKSGLGRGGAIASAKRRGMKVLVDHCVPHPLSMKKTTGEPGYDEWWSFWRPVLKDCEAADLVMVGSEYVKETFVEFGFPENKLRVVPLGVLPQFNHIKESYSTSGRLELIYTGNWGHWKGVDYLIDSIEILVRRGLDIHLTVCGSVPKTSVSYRKAMDLKLPVSFVGHVPQDALKDFLKSADVYVFPSLRDGFAVSAFEGMAAGLCLVTTRESSIPISDGETGFRIAAHSAEAIADRVEYLFSHRSEIARVGQRAAEVVEKEFTWQAYAANVQKVYTELLCKND